MVVVLLDCSDPIPVEDVLADRQVQALQKYFSEAFKQVSRVICDHLDYSKPLTSLHVLRQQGLCVLLYQLYNHYCQQSMDSKNALNEINKFKASTFEEAGKINGDTLASRTQSLSKTLG